ncbi:MAG: hypothetical protein ABF285_12985 [Pacificibacter sp.]|uniref:hypothetical protein n=1 Tax=Pacificibacter sp. TaxID=1917866 RepID=UPI00321B2C78
MKQLFFWFCLAVLGAVGAVSAQDAEADRFCALPPHDQICAAYPFDQTEFGDNFEYMIVAKGVQAPFDAFGWKGFVALNWRDVRGADGPDQWQNFTRTDAIVGLDPAGETCADAPGPLRFSDLVQADGSSLIAQNGVPVVYETRTNAVAAAYLNTAPSGDINFPRGGDTEDRPAVHVKTSWIALAGPDPRFISERGAVYVPAEDSLSAEAMCIEGAFGLVGMHVMAKVASGNGDEWIWATFEHRNTVPTSVHARKINSLFTKELFPNGCPAPDDLSAELQDYLLFDPTCEDCAVNQPLEGEVKWSQDWPHGVTPAGKPLMSNQITRCWQIFDATARTNAKWQAKLQGTPLAQYQLISVQWRGAQKSPIFEHGELPRFLSNVTMETFMQSDGTGSCLGCHAGAATSNGDFADFSFFLRDF